MQLNLTNLQNEVVPNEVVPNEVVPNEIVPNEKLSKIVDVQKCDEIKNLLKTVSNKNKDLDSALWLTGC